MMDARVERRWLRRWAGCVVLVVLLLATGCGGDDGTSATYTIGYSIEGTGTVSTLTYSTDGKSATKTLKNVRLPWKATVKVAKDGAPYTFRLTGTFTEDYSYTDSISVDGEVVVQSAGAASGSGALQGRLENSVDIS